MSNLRYTGPARPIATYRELVSDFWLYTSFALGLVVVGLDLFYWRF